MFRPLVCAFFAVSVCVCARGENWPRFRGPTGQGVSGEVGLPTTWSSETNIAWRRPIVGEGWSSPVVWESKVFLTTATAKGSSCHVLCLERDSGEVLWDVEVFQQSTGRKEGRNSYATPTPVTDGQRVYAFFASGGAAALDFAGNVVWKNAENSFYSQHGLGASPILYNDLLFLPWDHSTKTGPEMRLGWQIPWDQSFVLALDKNSGKERYRAKRGQTRIAHVTPNIVSVDGKPELISPAGDAIEAFEPATGKLLWWVTQYGEGVVPSPVFGDGVVYASSGFPTALPGKTVYPAIRAFRLGGGEGDLTKSNLLWEQKKNAPMIPSLLLVGDLLYSVTEGGVLQVLDAKTGQIVYTEKLKGQFGASPVFADGKIYCTNGDGATYVLSPGREFKLLATNELNEKVQASLAVSGGRLYLRTEKALYCIKP